MDELIKGHSNDIYLIDVLLLHNYFVTQVLEVLSSSSELLDLLHKVDAAYHSRLTNSSPASDHVLKYVSSIREQLKVDHAFFKSPPSEVLNFLGKNIES
jgi:hypothetical protein